MPQNKQALLLKNQLCHPLYSSSNALMRVYKPLLEKLDLTYPQYLVMLSLWESDIVPIKKISEETFFDSGTLTPLLKKLHEKSLIKIEIDPDDQRSRIISLSKKGSNLKEKAQSIPESLLCMINLESSKLVLLKKLLEEFHTNITKYELK